MAHNIATINGREAMAYQGESPWHKLGTRVPSMTSVEQALEAASLDWNVTLEPLFLADGRTVDSRRVVLRDIDNEILGTVGSVYTPVQNREAFDILSPACEEFGVTIETAGALGKGERVWMLAKMPDSLEPAAGDTVNGYFLVTTGHADSIAYSARFTPIRVVCQNTLNAAMTKRGSDVVRLPHLPGVVAKVDEAKRMVERMLHAMKETGETFGRMAEQRVSGDDVVKFIETVFPAKDDKVSPQLAERRSDVSRLIWEGVGADLAGSDANGTTAWGLYNAVTEYFDHAVPGKAKSPAAVRRANESAIFGGYNDIKLAALAAARELVAA